MANSKRKALPAWRRWLQGSPGRAREIVPCVSSGFLGRSQRFTYRFQSARVQLAPLPLCRWAALPSRRRFCTIDMSRARGRRQQLALAAIPEDEPAAPAAGAGPVAEIMQLIDGLEATVDEKVGTIMSAAEDAVLALKNECKRLLVLLPAKTRKMRLSEFQAAYPGDFQAGALEEIRERCAAMAAAAAAAPVPATGRGGRTAAKRAAEPETVLRTVRARRAQVAPPPKFSEAAPPLPAEAGVTATRQGTRSRLASSAAAAQRQEQTEQHPEPAGSRRSAAPPAAAAAGGSLFQGMPLQTPMPFQGEAVPLPITMLTQKRGGRTKAAPAPDAMVIQTADGQQWALGAEGVGGIPESHRREVTDLLTAQFNFFAAALGKTVFERDAKRGGRRR
ncbi:hypothetical protein ABPG77_010857 [Micractinium sp. CCAP 211/92]